MKFSNDSCVRKELQRAGINTANYGIFSPLDASSSVYGVIGNWKLIRMFDGRWKAQAFLGQGVKKEAAAKFYQECNGLVLALGFMTNIDPAKFFTPTVDRYYVYSKALPVFASFLRTQL